MSLPRLGNETFTVIETGRHSADGTDEQLSGVTAFASVDLTKVTHVLIYPETNDVTFTVKGEDPTAGTSPKFKWAADSLHTLAGRNLIQNLHFTAAAATIINIALLTNDPYIA